MKFLADENIDKPIVTRLRSDGHIVFYVAEITQNLKIYMQIAHVEK